MCLRLCQVSQLVFRPQTFAPGLDRFCAKSSPNLVAISWKRSTSSVFPLRVDEDPGEPLVVSSIYRGQFLEMQSVDYAVQLEGYSIAFSGVTSDHEHIC